MAAAEASLSTLIEVAVLQHPTVLQAQERFSAAGFDVESAKWGRFPTIVSETKVPNQNTQSLTKIEQPLWTGGRITAQIDLSEANQLVAREQVREAQFTVMQQLASAYLELLRMQARLEVADANVAEHGRLEALIGRRVAAEVSPAADRVQANARLQQAIAERVQIQRARDVARLALQQWSLSQVQAVRPIRSIEFIRGNAGVDDEEFVAKVFAAVPQRQRLSHQLKVAQAQRDLAFSQSFPSVVAGYQYIWGGTLPTTIDRGTAYLGLQFQPGAGLSALSNRQASTRREDAARQELAALERELGQQTRTILAEIDSSMTQLAPARLLLKASQDVVESYLRQYQVGRRNWVEVLNAQREKAQAAYSLADVESSRDQSILRLLIFAGEFGPGRFEAVKH